MAKTSWTGGVQPSHLVYEDRRMIIVVDIETGDVLRERWVSEKALLDIIAAKEAKDFARFLEEIDEDGLTSFLDDEYDDEDDDDDIDLSELLGG